MDHYLGVAREEGITDEEIGAVQSIVMAISSGRVRALFKEVEAERHKSKQQGVQE